MKRALQLTAIPKLAVFGSVPVVLILAVIMFKVVNSFLLDHNQAINLSVVSGEVKVIDANSGIAAGNNLLITPRVRTLLETDQGIASLELWDGSFLFVDSDTTIEFNPVVANDSGESFAFNLVKGRALIINEEDSQKSAQITIGGNIAIQVFHAALGLEVKTDGELRARVDCLVGHCLVNKVYQLASGQNAKIGPNNSVEVTDGVPYDTWISLGKASKPSPPLTNLIESIFPAVTQFTH